MFIVFSLRFYVDRKHTGERPYACDVADCDYAAGTASTLKFHERKHTGERPFPCSYPSCSYRAAVASALKKHFTVHQGPTEALVVCGETDCLFAATTHAALNRHTRVHEETPLHKMVHLPAPPVPAVARALLEETAPLPVPALVQRSTVVNIVDLKHVDPYSHTPSLL